MTFSLPGDTGTASFDKVSVTYVGCLPPGDAGGLPSKGVGDLLLGLVFAFASEGEPSVNGGLFGGLSDEVMLARRRGFPGGLLLRSSLRK